MNPLRSRAAQGSTTSAERERSFPKSMSFTYSSFMRPGSTVRLRKAFKNNFDVPVTEIGVVREKGDGIVILDEEKRPMELESC